MQRNVMYIHFLLLQDDLIIRTPMVREIVNDLHLNSIPHTLLSTRIACPVTNRFQRKHSNSFPVNNKYVFYYTSYSTISLWFCKRNLIYIYIFCFVSSGKVN